MAPTYASETSLQGFVSNVGSTAKIMSGTSVEQVMFNILYEGIQLSISM